jgi:hypothetical protein
MVDDTRRAQWPPSICAATGEIRSDVLHRPTVTEGAAPIHLSSTNELEQVAAEVPLSFHHRILQLPLSQMYPGWEDISDSSPAEASLFTRADSVIGSFDSFTGFADEDDIPGGTVNADDIGYRPMHVQYHLIESNDYRIYSGQNVADIYTSNRASETLHLPPPGYVSNRSLMKHSS